MVTFCFVNEGLLTQAAFDTYLAQYRPLFAALGSFHLIYVAASSVHIDKAKVAFGRYRDALQRNSRTSVRRMVAHFEARHLFETKQLATFDREKLLRLRQERREFGGARHEELYRLWGARGEAAILSALGTPAAPQSIDARFSSWLLDGDYALFGTLHQRSKSQLKGGSPATPGKKARVGDAVGTPRDHANA